MKYLFLILAALIIIIILNLVSFDTEAEKNIAINKEFNIEKTSCEIINIIGDSNNPDKTKVIYVLVRGTESSYQAKQVILNYLDTASLFPFKRYYITFFRYGDGIPLNALINNSIDEGDDLVPYRVFLIDFTNNMFNIDLIDNGKTKQSCMISIEEFTQGNRKKLLLERLKYVD
jgi:hypothetical protein